jgi:diguanylate cyclase (GGDEF)-like protein
MLDADVQEATESPTSVRSRSATDADAQQTAAGRARPLATLHGIWRAVSATWQRLVNACRRRSLIGEILGFQLLFACIIAMLALTGVWWASTWIIKDNMRNWGEQWLANLDELGMPLYVSDDDEKFLRIEDYVGKFDEISFVRYYSAEGEAIAPTFTRLDDVDLDLAPLDPKALGELSQRVSEDQRYVVETLLGDVPLVRITKPIWTESLLNDGLLGFDINDDSAVRKTLVGYVELGLDFSHYEAQLSRTMLMGLLIGGGVLVLLTGASWYIYRRALLPLSQLQKPLRELASGVSSTSVSTSGHKEIVAIADALNTTVTALNERDKRLWQLANHDPLTGLINRHRFEELLDEELATAGRGRTTSALLFIDLDQFKYVNDMHGHAAGDRLLKHVATELRHNVRKDDLVCRFGGDEFIVLIRDVSNKEIQAICEALLRMREHRFEETGDAFGIRCSIGVTIIRGENFTPTQLLAQADMACHQAKARGRNQFQIYKASDKELSDMAAEVGWSQQIQRALKEDAFVLHYQPIVDVETGEPVYYEALLRMRLGERKLIPPSAFLPAANRFGLMAEIDQWVIRNVVQKLAEFRSKGRDVRFTLNVSGSIFETADPFRYIQEHLERNAVPLDAIVLEITEQVAVQNTGNAAKQIAYLAEHGCKFAIDDFGAGHSSYKYLKTLPVDFVKIDGGFISNLVDDFIDQRIVSSICEIAKATRSQTIAEHVGDYRTLELLRELGVDYAQGFYLGKPSARLRSEPLPAAIGSAKKRRHSAN